MIKVENVHKIYGSGPNRVRALKGVSLEIQEKEFVFIVGPSGSGKTTLLDMIGGLLRPTKGRVLYNKKNIYEMNDDELSLFRRNTIGFVFQAYNLIPSLTVLENILVPLYPQGITEKDVKKARELLKIVGLQEKENRKPSELSGGERQRVAIARAMINDPLVILDEPTGNLDSKTGEVVMNYFRKINKEKGTTIVVVTHDIEYIRKKDTVYKIKDGTILNE
jgi:putative ABC transport system ATP-binding protein